ncbi:MAG: hypothetical protein O7C75_14755 [Verrucomicrobia bacterium]|nr:hypothetical protein [Verrucomicrobiota bacterium]
METNSGEIPSYSLFSIRAIGVATFLGGPLAGGVLIGLNFDKLGNKKARNYAYVLGTLSTVLIFWGILSLPSSIIDRVPNLLIPAIYTFIVVNLAKKFQLKAIESNLERGGNNGSGWVVAGVSLVAMALILATIVGYAWSIKPYEFEGEAYIHGIQKNEIYHNEDVEEQTLKQFGDYLMEWGYFHPEYAGTAQIQKVNSGYKVYLAYPKMHWIDPGFLEKIRSLGSDLEEQVLKDKVAIILVSEDTNGIHHMQL